MDFVSTLITALLSAAFAAVFTTFLSLRQFYRQQWWQRKLDAYISVLDCLHHMSSMYEVYFHEEIHASPVTSEERAALVAKYSAATAELRRLLDMGELIFSPDATTRLRLMFKQIDAKQDSWFEAIDAAQFALQKCLEDFKAVAMRDLELTRGFLPSWKKLR